MTARLSAWISAGIFFFLLSSVCAAQTLVTACGTLSGVGSYKLANNLLASPGANCIKIAATAVTLDLNGFRIATSGGGSGITDAGVNQAGVVVKNGKIRGFQVDINRAATPGAILQDVAVASATVGIKLAAGSQAFNSTSGTNTSTGIIMGDGSVMVGGGSSANGADGLDCGVGCTIRGATFSANKARGIKAGIATQIYDSIAGVNTLTGIVMGSGSVLTGGASGGNGADGVDCGDACVIKGATFGGNKGHGILAGGGASVSSVSAPGNGGSGVIVDYDSGVRTGDSSLNDVRAFGNTKNGIDIGFNSQVLDSLANSNHGSGVVGRTNDAAINTIASHNSSYGIYVNCPANLRSDTAAANSFSNIFPVGPGCVRNENLPAP